MQRMKKWIVAALGVVLLGQPAPVSAQALAERVARAPDGVVRMTFPSRPGVCGHEGAITVRDTDDGRRETHVLSGSRGRGRWGGDGCRPGPVRVELRVSGGAVQRVDTSVGESDRPVRTDLGRVPAAEAVDYLLSLAERSDESVGGDAIGAAALADGPPLHPRLLRLATASAVPAGAREKAVFWAGQTGAPTGELLRVYREANDGDVREAAIFALSRREDRAARDALLRIARGPDDPDARRQAIFWLGQMAGRELADDLVAIVEDEGELEVREHAIFALSQRPADEAVPALIRIARESPSARLREKAVFWLAQTGDPRALAFFEETLR